MIRPYDRDALRQSFSQARPFPHVVIDGFLEEGFAREVAASYPTFEGAEEFIQGARVEGRRRGRRFENLHEHAKIQITEPELFPEAVHKLNEAVCADQFLEDLSYITGIPDLMADVQLNGAGMHVHGPQGALDVHADFNYIRGRGLYRRANLIIYLNEGWQQGWGGEFEAWDPDVKNCVEKVAPMFNRCVLFITRNDTFHGVSAVQCPPGVSRLSFATFCYTRERPDWWDDTIRSTVYKARPDEWWKGHVSMPLFRLKKKLRAEKSKAKAAINRMLRRKQTG